MKIRPCHIKNKKIIDFIVTQFNKFMKHQSLPKPITMKQKYIQPEIGEAGWSNFLRPIDESMPQHSFQCLCKMCKNYEHKKFIQALDTQSKSFSTKIKTRLNSMGSSKLINLQQNYHWIVQHLLLPHNKIATNGLSIFIAESLFLRDGEMSELFLSKQLQDPTIKKISKDKLNNTFIQKIMTERRRKYKDYIRLKTGKKKLQQKKKVFFGQKQVKKEIKDAVLIRYVDGYQQLFTQNQFLALLLKRKQDPVWKQIISIRNFINVTNPEQQGSKYVAIKYRKEKIKYEQLYHRAANLMKVYGEYITVDDKNYIKMSDQHQFCKQLQQNSQEVYAEYLVYQIVNFVEYFYDEQIENMVIGIYFDEIHNPFINQIYKLKTKSLIKFEWTNQIYRKRMDEQQTKVLTAKQITNQSQIQNGANVIAKFMHSAYQKLRDHYGLNAEDEDNQEQIANNNFFRVMHPGFQYNISDVLKDNDLSVDSFKLKYLGFKEEKKPIVKQFTSTMIKTIHLASPRLRSSQPHTYIGSPFKSTKQDLLSTSRKTNASQLSPIKKHTNRIFYQTLPLKQTI